MLMLMLPGHWLCFVLPLLLLVKSSTAQVTSHEMNSSFFFPLCTTVTMPVSSTRRWALSTQEAALQILWTDACRSTRWQIERPATSTASQGLQQLLSAYCIFECFCHVTSVMLRDMRAGSWETKEHAMPSFTLGQLAHWHLFMKNKKQQRGGGITGTSVPLRPQASASFSTSAILSASEDPSRTIWCAINEKSGDELRASHRTGLYIFSLYSLSFHCENRKNQVEQYEKLSFFMPLYTHYIHAARCLTATRTDFSGSFWGETSGTMTSTRRLEMRKGKSERCQLYLFLHLNTVSIWNDTVQALSLWSCRISIIT